MGNQIDKREDGITFPKTRSYTSKPGVGLVLYLYNQSEEKLQRFTTMKRKLAKAPREGWLWAWLQKKPNLETRKYDKVVLYGLRAMLST
jgi:hypothetical protein